MGQTGSAPGSSQDHPGADGADDIPQDLYELLGVAEDATSEEIRRGFRKEALKWHPDKNAGSEEASRRFVKIQAAYDILSDNHERAYYDSHRNDIGSDDVTEDFDFRAKATQAAANNQAVRISARHLMRFFDASLWNGNFTDDEKGFYGIYRVLFDTISQSEYYATAPHGEPALSTPPSHYPSFGISTTSYDAPESGLRSFYNAYLNFSSRRAFAEVDKYRLSDAPDRRVKRLMEKENKRARDDARREYNDAVRNLAQFVKKRDPRFLTSQSKDPLKVQQLERERQRNKLRQAAVEAAKEREANARQFQAQSWQRVDAEISDDDSDEDDEENADDGGSGADGSDADFVEDDTNGSLDGRSEDGIGDETEDDEINDFFCPACEKQFASQGAWDNHEQSKKHLKNMQRLKKQMQAEDSELGLSGGVAGVDLTGSSTPSGPPDVEGEDGLPRMSNKEKKRLKKKFGIDLHAALDDAADLEPAPLETSEKSEHRRATQETPPADSVTTEGDEAGHSNDVEELALDRAETPAAEDRQQQAETKPELSKREKRRMKEAAKKASGTSTPGESCNVCGATFPSRSKLFDHIAEEGHAAAREVTSKGKASSKKGKKR